MRRMFLCLFISCVQFLCSIFCAIELSFSAFIFKLFRTKKCRKRFIGNCVVFYLIFMLIDPHFIIPGTTVIWNATCVLHYKAILYYPETEFSQNLTTLRTGGTLRALP